MQYLTSKSGFRVPALGLGTWQADKGAVQKAIEAAIDIGIRYFDCAYIYRNEDEVGDAIATKVSQNVVKREDLFVTSKLWNTFHRPDLVRGACQQTLDKLRLDYLDLFLIHWPMAYKEESDLFPKDENDQILFSDVNFLDTWKAMEELVDAGLCKAIGLSNFNSVQIQQVLDSCRIPPANLQVESSPYFVNQKLIEFAQSRGITVTVYSPLGSPTRPWAKPDDPTLMDEPMLTRIGEKYKKSPAQVLIRYQLDRGVGVIPKSSKPHRIRENFEVLDFSLTPEEVAEITAFDKKFRAVPMTASLKHKYFPFGAEF